MPAKGFKQQDTAITKHGNGFNSDESRATLRTFLRRYEHWFDQLNEIVRARQGAPRSERTRGLDIKGVGQMIGKTQNDRSKVLANMQAKRTRNILASMAKLIIRFGGVSENDIIEAFRPNGLDVVADVNAEPSISLGDAECESWTIFASKEHGNGENTDTTQACIAHLLTLFSKRFETIWDGEGATVDGPKPKRTRFENEDEKSAHKKHIACLHAKFQANRNRVVLVALAKTLLRKRKILDSDIIESFQPNNLEGSTSTSGTNDVFVTTVPSDNQTIYVAMPVLDAVDDLFGY